MTCYNTNKTTLKAINDSPNILFLCDECLENKKIVSSNVADDPPQDMDTREGDNNAIFKAIHELKDIVVDMQSNIKNLEKPSYRNVLASNLNAGNSKGSAKRMRFMDNILDTPTTRPRYAIIGNNNVDKELAAVETRKWIFVSQLHPSTTEKSLIDFTCKRLNDTENSSKIQAFALVPKEKNRDELNFISFKVNIPEPLYAPMLKPEIWPNGVIVRDFVNDQRRRRPTGHFLPKTPIVDLLI